MAAVVDAVLAGATDLTRRFAPDAAGVVVPGLVDEASGLALFSANLRWRDIPFPHWLAEELGIPVVLGHDVRAAALAEARFGAGRGCRSFLYVSLGDGVAAATVLDGRVLAGGHGRAGEIGHVVVRPDGPLCGCGLRGCVESLAGAPALVRQYREAGGPPGLTAPEILRRPGSDSAAEAARAAAVDALAAGLGPVIALLDPRRLVLGGPLLQGVDVGHLDRLHDALARRLGVPTLPDLQPAQLGATAACLGAALLARRETGQVCRMPFLPS
ncbi:glucokinase [Streptacidiphilus sp. MAP12-20]